jgi:Coenzyme PQQ synthesis protein D (PqqD)
MDQPRARRDDLLTTKLDDEVVVYDPESKRAHSLNRLAVTVWNHADGSKSVDELRQAVSDEIGTPIDTTAVVSAIRKLERAHLLLNKVAAVGPMTRREMLSKSGKFGAAAMATPLIASAFVPIAAAAASVVTHPECTGATCTTFTPCSSTNGDCVCGSICGPSGPGGICVPGSTACGSLVACAADLSCPSGSVCACDSCCGIPVCVPVGLTAACPTTAAPITTHRTSTGAGTFGG